jgi:transcriptional regulator with GAF, ATPase, and Fis domain
VLQSGEVTPVGGRRVEKVDVRILAATHRDLEKEVRDGRFREDLLYRLRVVPIHIPPLRERPEDLRALAEHFVERYSEELSAGRHVLAEGTLERLRAYDWPGNVRELSNVIERSVITSTEGTLRLAARLSGGGQPSPASTNDHRGTLHQVEKAHIEQVLKETSRPGRCILYACAMDEETVEELKGHFGIVAEDLRSEVRAVAEGQALAAQRLDSGLAHLEGRMDRGFGELQSMIRLSYTEIDRRFSELEGEVSDLRSRVERLETREA